MKAYSKILLNSSILLLFLILFTFIYSPVIQHHFVTFADYNFLWTYESKWVNAESFISFIQAQPYEGRFLDNLYYYLTYNKYVNSLRSLEAASTVRFISIISVGLFAFVLYLIFKENRFKSLHAFLISVLICTLPPIWRYVSILFVTHMPFCMLLSALAALILFKVVWKEERGKTSHIAVAILTAIVLLFLALNIYQPPTMVFWALALIPLMKLQHENFMEKWRFPIAIYFATGFSAMIIYFAIIKIMYYLMGVGLQSRGGFIKIYDLYPQLIWFIKTPLYIASNLWDISRTKEVSLVAGIIIIAGILSGFGRAVLQVKADKRGGNLLTHLLCRYLLIFSLIPLSYLAHLVIKFYDMPIMAYHRNLISLEVVILLFLYWSLMNIAEFFNIAFNFSVELQKKIITIGLIILTVFTALSANYYTDRYFAEFSEDELTYIENAINEYGVANISSDTKIHIISDAAPHLEALANFIILDLTLASSIVNQYAISMVKLTLYELGVNSNMPIEFIRTDESHFPKDKNILIVDMRDFQKSTYKELDHPLTLQSLFRKYTKTEN